MPSSTAELRNKKKVDSTLIVANLNKLVEMEIVGKIVCDIAPTLSLYLDLFKHHAKYHAYQLLY